MVWITNAVVDVRATFEATFEDMKSTFTDFLQIASAGIVHLSPAVSRPIPPLEVDMVTISRYSNIWANLPKDVIELIISCLDSTSAMKMSTVSKFFLSATRSSRLWKLLCTRFMEHHDIEDVAQQNAVLHIDVDWMRVHKQLYWSFKDSKILSINDKSKLLGWLMQIDMYKSWQLCYRGSRDGFGRSPFSKRCTERGSTLLITRTPEGYIFGGFNPEPWTRAKQRTIYAKQAFLFSLINPHNKPPTIMYVQDEKLACHVTPHHGPLWGTGYDLGFFNLNSQEKIGWTRLGSNYKCPYNDIDAKNFLAGKTEFEINEIEVYQCVDVSLMGPH